MVSCPRLIPAQPVRYIHTALGKSEIRVGDGVTLVSAQRQARLIVETIPQHSGVFADYIHTALAFQSRRNEMAGLGYYVGIPWPAKRLQPPYLYVHTSVVKDEF